MNPWLQAFSYIGIGGVLAAVITGLFSRRKLSADATKIITDAASGVVAELRTELGRAAQANALLTGKVEAGQLIQTQQQEHLRSIDQAVAMHVLWDRQAYATLRESGIELPEPPPLPGSMA